MAINPHYISEALSPLGLNVIRIEQKMAQSLFGTDILVDINCAASPFGGRTQRVNEYTPKRILKSGNRTIVFWADGTKTIVKRAEDETESDYNAFCAALGIKLYGSNSALKRIVERTETQKKRDKHLVYSEDEKMEEGQKWFKCMMDVAGMEWTCPHCKTKAPYKYDGKGVFAFCNTCGAYTEIVANAAQKEADCRKTQKGGNEHGEKETL